MLVAGNDPKEALRSERASTYVFEWGRMTYRAGERFEVPAFHELALNIQPCISD